VRGTESAAEAMPRSGNHPLALRFRRHGKTVSMLAAIALVAFAAGCGADDDDGAGAQGGAAAPQPVPSDPPPHKPAKVEDAQPGSGEGLKIGYVSLDESNAFWRAAGQGIREQITRSGATGVYCDARRTPEGALNCVKNLKTKQVDGYIITQQDPNATERICAAGPQDVPVISYDVLQDPCSKSLAGANNAYAGYIAGRELALKFRAKFNCEYDAYVSLEALDAGKLNADRMGGYRSGFESVCGKIHDERKENAITADQTRPVMTNILTALPGAERIAVVAVDDDGLVGAFAAARAAGRSKDIYGSGQGVQPFAWCPILENPDNWVASTGYFNEDWGKLTVPYLIEAIREKKQPPASLEIGHKVITAKNLAEYYPQAEAECS
jgi:ribose transport system substrate-binding protein